ncbi:hypothetical protein CB1_000402003 [Camelus ferus]|nr:hypothetical protein CB1_000402003 [Camelus ferus]
MQGMPVRNTGSPKSAVKTRQAFFLHTTYFTKFARQVCKNTLRLRQAARRPFVPINYAAIRAEYMTSELLSELSEVCKITQRPSVICHVPERVTDRFYPLVELSMWKEAKPADEELQPDWSFYESHPPG